MGFRPWEVPSEAALEEKNKAEVWWSVELATGSGWDGILTLKRGNGDATAAPQRPMMGLHLLPGARPRWEWMREVTREGVGRGNNIPRNRAREGWADPWTSTLPPSTARVEGSPQIRQLHRGRHCGGNPEMAPRENDIVEGDGLLGR